MRNRTLQRLSLLLFLGIWGFCGYSAEISTKLIYDAKEKKLQNYSFLYNTKVKAEPLPADCPVASDKIGHSFLAKNDDPAKPITLRSLPCKLPVSEKDNGYLQARITLKGAATLKIFLYRPDWKTPKGWQGMFNFKCNENELKEYTCRIKIPEVDASAPFFLRFDITGKGDVIVCDPQLEFISATPKKENVAPEKPKEGAAIFKLDGESGVTAQNGKNELAPVEAVNIGSVDGVSGKALAIPLDGVLNYNIPAINPRRGAVSLWFKVNWMPWSPGTNTEPMIFNRIFESGGGANLRGAIFKMKNRLGVPGDIGITGLIYPEEWHHLVMNWDGDIAQGYLDGKLFSLCTSKFNSGTFGPLLLGSNDRRKGLDGALDELVLYDGPLSGDTISRQFAEHIPVFTTPLDLAGIEGKSQIRLEFENFIHDEVQEEICAEILDPKKKMYAAKRFA